MKIKLCSCSVYLTRKKLDHWSGLDGLAEIDQKILPFEGKEKKLILEMFTMAFLFEMVMCRVISARCLNFCYILLCIASV